MRRSRLAACACHTCSSRRSRWEIEGLRVAAAVARRRRARCDAARCAANREQRRHVGVPEQERASGRRRARRRAHRRAVAARMIAIVHDSHPPLRRVPNAARDNRRRVSRDDAEVPEPGLAPTPHGPLDEAATPPPQQELRPTWRIGKASARACGQQHPLHCGKRDLFGHFICRLQNPYLEGSRRDVGRRHQAQPAPRFLCPTPFRLDAAQECRYASRATRANRSAIAERSLSIR